MTPRAVGGGGYKAFWESRTYNSLLQLTQIQSTGGTRACLARTSNMSTRPRRTTGASLQTIDASSGEQVSYQYDALNRLMHAETAGNTWGETYQYDGFGNLTAKTPTKGSAPAWSATYNAATNWQTGVQYDANGNPPVGTLDVENRLVNEIDPSTGDTMKLLYDPWGKRVGRGPDERERLSIYALWGDGAEAGGVGLQLGQWSTCATANSNVYFKGRLLIRDSGATCRRTGWGRWGRGLTYFPYGEEQGTPTADGQSGSRRITGTSWGRITRTSGITTASGEVPDAGSEGRDFELATVSEPICLRCG